MAAIAMPISEIEPIRTESRKAQAETECVAVCSGKEHANKSVALAIAWKTFVLRFRLQSLTSKQTKLISRLVDTDFNRSRVDDLESLAVSIDGLVAGERNILMRANSLGAEIRAWWETSLLTLAEQVEYLDSIATSLHSAADPKVSELMGLAVRHMAESRQLVGA